MIRLKKIEIHVNEEFSNENELDEFKNRVTTDVARYLDNKPTVYSTFETRENQLIINK